MGKNLNPFLKQVAARFATKSIEELTDICFVFPNNRSGVFFQKYLIDLFDENKEDGKILFLPEITTLAILVEKWCKVIEASHLELLLLLYKTYLELTKKKGIKDTDANPTLLLERFFFWGEIVLNDFDELDRNLSDASHIYRNLKDLKEMTTNPLSEEQINLIKRFWNTTGAPWSENDDARMWIGKADESSNPGIKNFLRLWEILGPLYDEFNRELDFRGLCYNGSAYRKAVSHLDNLFENGEQPEKRLYVFVGFSHLSASERKIFSILAKNDFAEFYWDTVLPTFAVKDDFPLKLIKSYARSFPAPDDFCCEGNDEEPVIEILNVPSETTQARVAADILDRDEALKRDTALEYAVVLPETNLCIPFLQSLAINREIPVNITMGYPLRQTPVASLIEEIATLHSNVRIEEGEPAFFRRNIISIFSNPLLIDFSRTECTGLLDEINKNRKYYIPVSEIKDKVKSLSFLVDYIDENAATVDIISGLSRILENLLNLFPFFEENDPYVLDRGFLKGYLTELGRLKSLIEKYDLAENALIGEDTVIRTVGKILKRMSVTFQGNPLCGLQIMGILETRALDFENIIITSMNERVFPRKFEIHTFIPQSLRAAYGLGVRDEEEIVMAYHFYRLLGRAKNIRLIYNSSTEGTTSGEPSRYIYQLKYLFQPPKLKEITYTYSVTLPEKREIKIVKTPEISKQLNRFLATETDNKKYFSASRIIRLLKCELDFYLSDVCGYNLENDDSLNMSDSVYGDIVHWVMCNVYYPEGVDKNGIAQVRISVSTIENILKSGHIHDLTVKSVNKYYFKKDNNGLSDELTGESKIFGELAEISVRRMLKAEIEMLKKMYIGQAVEPHFLLESAEQSKLVTLRLHDMEVNFRYVIDRVDRLSDENGGYRLRIVDYKTGGDDIAVSSLESLCDYSVLKKGQNPPKAVTQLMLYCNAFAQDPGNHIAPDASIQPIVYKFRDIDSGKPLQPITIGKKDDKIELTDYLSINEEFTEMMANKLKEFFDPNVPIRQTENEDMCKYCSFKDICRR